MALSEYEKRMLEELESQLRDVDDELSEGVANTPQTVTQWGVAPRNLILGLIIAVIGLLVVLAGVAAEIVAIGVLGVAIVFVGFWYLSNGIIKRRRIAPPSTQPQSKDSGPSMMEKQAQEWLRRMQERGEQ